MSRSSSISRTTPSRSTSTNSRSNPKTTTSNTTTAATSTTGSRKGASAGATTTSTNVTMSKVVGVVVGLVLMTVQCLNLNASLQVVQSADYIKRVLKGHQGAITTEEAEVGAWGGRGNVGGTSSHHGDLVEIKESIHRIEEHIGIGIEAQAADTTKTTLTVQAAVQEAVPAVTVTTVPTTLFHNNHINADSYHHQLSVPFYIYDSPPLDWSQARRYRNGKWEFLTTETNYAEYKHSDDYWFLRAAKQHPMRTTDPTKAQLFFVPALFNAYHFQQSRKPMSNKQRTSNNTLCVHQWCDDDLLRATDEALKASPYYQASQGRDHILVESHFLKRVWWTLGHAHSALFHCNLITFETKLPNSWMELHGSSTTTTIGSGDSGSGDSNSVGSGSIASNATDTAATATVQSSPSTTTTTLPQQRFSIPSMYVGRPCPPETVKTHDFAMIARFKPGNPSFQSRFDVCSWLLGTNDLSFSSGTSSTTTDNNHNDTTTATTATQNSQQHQRQRRKKNDQYKVSRCGLGDQCPALAQAKYGFHVRGDSWGANRLMDTLLSGSVPLFTHPNQYSILPDFVPWPELGYMVDVTTQEAFDASLQDLLARPESEYQSKRQLARDRYWHVLDHRHPGQFDIYMVHFAQRLELQMPTTTSTTSSRSTVA